MPFVTDSVSNFSLAGTPATSAAVMATLPSEDPIYGSSRQVLSSLLSEFLKSHAETLVSELLSSIRPAILRGVQACEATPPQRDSNNSASIQTGNVALRVNPIGTPKNPSSVNKVVAPLIDQTPKIQDCPSYRQILLLTTTKNDMNETSAMISQRKGEFLDDALVKYVVSELAHSLIGKLSLAPGDSPYSLDTLHAKLS